MYNQNLGSVILDVEHFELFPELLVSFARDVSSGMTGTCDFEVEALSDS